MTRRVSLFDLGVYAGGAYSSPWFETGGDNFAPGFGPIFGLTGTFWFSPTVGVRAHGAFLPTNLPEGEDTFGDGNDSFIVNNYLYDLNLAFRPWAMNETASPFMSSTYFFLGGGGLTSNTAGTFPANCYPFSGYTNNGVCVPTEADLGTVGQGNIGVGFDFFPVTSAIGLFGELAVHGYDSPAHVEPVVVQPPVIDTPVTPQPQPDDIRQINVCVVENGQLREVQAQYNATRGDTTVNGQAFSTAYPSTTGYAAGATWYINSDVITVGGQRYVKFGLPRVLGVNEVTRTTDFQGVPVFAETGATGTPDIIYVPVRTGCEFQPYQREQKVRNVRG
jgi:hypothetical protein